MLSLGLSAGESVPFRSNALPYSHRSLCSVFINKSSSDVKISEVQLKHSLRVSLLYMTLYLCECRCLIGLKKTRQNAVIGTSCWWASRFDQMLFHTHTYPSAVCSSTRGVRMWKFRSCSSNTHWVTLLYITLYLRGCCCVTGLEKAQRNACTGISARTPLFLAKYSLHVHTATCLREVLVYSSLRLIRMLVILMLFFLFCLRVSSNRPIWARSECCRFSFWQILFHIHTYGFPLKFVCSSKRLLRMWKLWYCSSRLIECDCVCIARRRTKTVSLELSAGLVHWTTTLRWGGQKKYPLASIFNVIQNAHFGY